MERWPLLPEIVIRDRFEVAVAVAGIVLWVAAMTIGMLCLP